ncbi:hypothetical protein WNZ14_21980 [Hoeflea sp. AS60]|uniref:hypothetical protein n=1 Tax=Hoeflea sp. AS60 TaxID=3135780 RepID=UPI00317A94AB
MFEAFSPYVPVTVIGAIILFIIREVLEFRRRRGADQRKLQAIRHFIARDLELCQSAIRSYRGVLEAFKRVEMEPGRQIRIFVEPSGRLHYEHWCEDEDETPFRSGGMFAPVVNTFAARFMLDIATLDSELYKQVESTTDELSELKHIKGSLMEQAERPIHRDGFIEYAAIELNDIEKSIRSLYKICTGLDEIKPRIR